jgi:ubiquitin C-terminal hydrolase
MGNCNVRKFKKIQDFKESWEYEGVIYKNNINIHDIYYKLSGNIYIKEVKKKEIQIQGIINDIRQKKKNNFELIGKEKSDIIQNQGTISFEIRNENDIQLNEIKLIKNYNDNAKLKGYNIFIKNKGPFFLNLDLYNHQENNYKSIWKINEFYPHLSKISEEEILKNSLCGMKNLINTCYINSSLQILIHIPEFIKIIRRNSDFEYNIIGEINKIFDQILEKYKEYRPVINPGSLVNYFKFNSNHPEYANYSQKDSEMFLEELIWDINIELGNLNIQRTNRLYQNINNENKEKVKNFSDYITESEIETNFEINDLFYVYFIHEKKCKECNYKTYYFDQSPGLKLNFEQTKYETQIYLSNLIKDNLNNPITFKSKIICQNCRKCSDIIETTKIVKLPKILILTLQKVNYESTQKTPWIVKDIKRIGIRGYVDISLIQNEFCIYEIFAINNHLGNSPKSGHYFSQIYLDDPKGPKGWYYFNDESVSKCLDLNPNINNYILFYKQLDK